MGIEKTRVSVFFQLYSFFQNEIYYCVVILASPVIFAYGEIKRMNIISLNSKNSISMLAKQVILLFAGANNIAKKLFIDYKTNLWYFYLGDKYVE